MVNWILLNEVSFKCILTIIGSFLPRYSWIYRNPLGMWESPLLQWQPLSILHTALMPPGEIYQMHGSSQLLPTMVALFCLSSKHYSHQHGPWVPLWWPLPTPLPSSLCPQISSHTIKIPNYSLSLSLHLHNFPDMLSFSTLLSYDPFFHTRLKFNILSKLPDSSRQYYLPSALQPQNTSGVPLMWGLVFPIVRMSWYRLTWWVWVVGTLLTFLLFEIL